MRKSGAAIVSAMVLFGCGPTHTASTSGSGSGGGAAQHSLHLRVSGNGQIQGPSVVCRNDCQQQIDSGTAVQLIASADPGWKFDGWQGDCAGAATCDLTMAADHSATATFSSVAPANVRVDVKLTGDGSGRVLSTPSGIDCPGNCGMTVAAGTAVTLSALPTPNSSFAGFGGACSGKSCSFTAGSDAVAWANFTLNPPPPPSRHKLSVSLTGQGSVTSSPAGLSCSGGSCSSDFDAGISVTLTAAPASGWTFASWSGACSGTASCTVKLDSDAQVSARFDAPPPPPANAHVIVTVNGRGQVTGSGLSCGNGASACDTVVAAGTSVTLNASAGNQARFSGWGGPCGGAGSSCTFTANGEVRVTASFAEVVLTLVANDATNLTALAINSTDVFYGRYTNADGGSIWAVSKSGGQPRRVASGYAVGMAADDSYVYWNDYHSIYSAPAAGGSASQIFAGGGIGKLALDGQGALYFTTSVGYTNQGSLHRMRDRGDTILASNVTIQSGVAVDDAHAYFAILDSSQNGFLQRVPKLGGAAETMVGCGSYCQISALKADAANVYVRSFTGQAWSVSKASPSLVVLTAPNGTSNGYALTEIDAWGSVVYWNFLYSQNNLNGIFSAQSDGSHWTAVETASDSNWIGLRVDDNALYYWHSWALLRRLK